MSELVVQVFEIPIDAQALNMNDVYHINYMYT